MGKAKSIEFKCVWCSLGDKRFHQFDDMFFPCHAPLEAGVVRTVPKTKPARVTRFEKPKRKKK